MKLTISHEFRGMSDYWGGNGRRWDADAGCVFAYYGKDTTLRDCVNQWVEDFWNGGDFDNSHLDNDPFADVTEDDIRAAILESMTEQGRADYESGTLCDGAADWEGDSDKWSCSVCRQSVTVESYEYAEIGCPYCAECDREMERDDDAEYCESPVWILLIELEDYEDEDEWDLCQHDDGYFLWVSKDGYEKKPYPSEDAALADNPN